MVIGFWEGKGGNEEPSRGTEAHTLRQYAPGLWKALIQNLIHFYV